MLVLTVTGEMRTGFAGHMNGEADEDRLRQLVNLHNVILSGGKK